MSESSSIFKVEIKTTNYNSKYIALRTNHCHLSNTTCNIDMFHLNLSIWPSRYVAAGFITNKVPIARITLPYKDPRTRIIKFDLGPTALGQIL